MREVEKTNRSEIDQRKPNSRANGVHKQGHSLHHTTHISRRLAMGILETGDASQDFGESDEDITAALCPHRDVDGRATLVGRVITAFTALVDVVLDHAGPDHGRRGDKVSGGDSLDRREVEAHLAQGWVDEDIEERDHDYQGEGVEVCQDVVGHTV